MKVELFRLTGTAILRQEEEGNRMALELTDGKGQRLPSGVYLYIVNVWGTKGERWTSRLNKIIVLGPKR
jgi:hypothetical protein